MGTVLVFKTSVSGEGEVRELSPFLDGLINPSGRWNFDLEDCDNILRVETKTLGAAVVRALMHRRGFWCEELSSRRNFENGKLLSPNIKKGHAMHGPFCFQ